MASVSEAQVQAMIDQGMNVVRGELGALRNDIGGIALQAFQQQTLDIQQTKEMLVEVHKNADGRTNALIEDYNAKLLTHMSQFDLHQSVIEGVDKQVKEELERLKMSAEEASNSDEARKADHEKLKADLDVYTKKLDDDQQQESRG